MEDLGLSLRLLVPGARNVKHSAIFYPICTVKNCSTPDADKPSWEAIKPQREREIEREREREREMEVPQGPGAQPPPFTEEKASA